MRIKNLYKKFKKNRIKKAENNDAFELLYGCEEYFRKEYIEKGDK